MTIRLLATATLFSLAPFAAHAQATQIAMAETPLAVSSSSLGTALPDAPDAQPDPAVPATFSFGGPATPVASKYATIIQPGQSSVPLHGMEKVAYGLHDAFSIQQLAGITLSAGWSHVIDSAPHYGTNSEAFGKREGAAALRSTVQTVATDALFSPMFHDDPRYFVMGDQQKFVKRVVYAATRVVLVRSSYSNKNHFNAPLLLGYGVAAATNNAYYPDRDRGFGNTMQSYAGSLGGAVLGFEVNEFLDDALRMVHLRK